MKFCALAVTACSLVANTAYAARQSPSLCAKTAQNETTYKCFKYCAEEAVEKNKNGKGIESYVFECDNSCVADLATAGGNARSVGPFGANETVACATDCGADAESDIKDDLKDADKEADSLYDDCTATCDANEVGIAFENEDDTDIVVDDDDQNGENDIIIFVDDGYQDDGEPVPEPTDDKPAEDEDTGKEVSSTERVVRSRSPDEEDEDEDNDDKEKADESKDDEPPAWLKSNVKTKASDCYKSCDKARKNRYNDLRDDAVDDAKKDMSKCNDKCFEAGAGFDTAAVSVA
eukprot:scaffold232_cov203-Alexandrium_tamarense.AAC.23